MTLRPSLPPPAVNLGLPADKAWCFYREDPREELYPVVRIGLFQRWGATPQAFSVHWSSSGPRMRLQGAQLALPAMEPSLFEGLRDLADSRGAFSPVELALALEELGLYNLDAQRSGPAHLRFDQARLRAAELQAQREAQLIAEAAAPGSPSPTEATEKPRRASL